MPAFTGSVNPKLSYKSLVNMGQKARKHWAHAFMWMLVWFLPLKMLLQTRQKHLTMATSPPSGSNHWGGAREFRSFQNWIAVLRAGSREQSTVHCKVQIHILKVLTSIWVVPGPLCLQRLCGSMDGQFRGVWQRRSWSPYSNGSHTYLLDTSEFLLTTVCPHLCTPYLEFLRAQSLVQRCILSICYPWVI